jgi:hypothetical protein
VLQQPRAHDVGAFHSTDPFDEIFRILDPYRIGTQLARCALQIATIQEL